MADPIRYLSVEDVLRIRDRLAQQYGDSFDVLRFQQLLSALATPQQSLFGEEIFPTLCAKAGMLLTSLVRNHPFWDGNKRIALAAIEIDEDGYVSLQALPDVDPQLVPRVRKTMAQYEETLQRLL